MLGHLASMNHKCRLYLITPPTIIHEFPAMLTEALEGGDVACVQARFKGAEDKEILAIAQDLREICFKKSVAFIINDRPDLAKKIGADGVHLGQEDPSIHLARQMLEPKAIVGVTCHNSKDLAIAAADQGADYVAFGAFFNTSTKIPRSRCEIDILKWWSDLLTVPSVAIGGINPNNCAGLVGAKADFLAVSSAIWGHPGGPGLGVKAFNEAIIRALD